MPDKPLYFTVLAQPTKTKTTRRQLRINHFEALRKKIMPFAEARGYLTDDDVFRDVMAFDKPPWNRKPNGK